MDSLKLQLPQTARESYQDILDLMLQSTTKTGVRYHNDNLSKCWEKKNCEQKDCPAYDNQENLRCWQIAGTFCGQMIQGELASKIGDCRRCEVFQAACHSETATLGEYFNNMTFLLENEKTQVESLNKGLIAILKDLEKKNEEITRLTLIDNLTGLYNQRYMMRSLDYEIQRAKRYESQLSFLMLDVDKFKSYNDSFGHLAGDALLAMLGTIVKNSIRTTDIACRYGGDEFIVIFPETQLTDALLIAEKIRKHLGSHAFYPEVDNYTPQYVTVSIGLSTLSERDYTAESLISQADKGMYAAKKEGGNRVHIFSWEHDREQRP